METKLTLFRGLLITLFLTISASASASEPFTFANNPIPMSWSGFYVAGDFGSGWGLAKWTYQNDNFFNTTATLRAGNDFHFDLSGVAGGGDFGFNYQSQRLIVGMETSVWGADFTPSMASPFFPATDTYTALTHLFLSVKGRLGVAFDRFLGYLNIGWAGGRSSLRLTNAIVNNVYAGSTYWGNGWLLGSGIDYRLLRPLSLGIVYNFVQVSFKDKAIYCALCSTGPGNGTPIVKNRTNANFVTLRLTYLFSQ